MKLLHLVCGVLVLTIATGTASAQTNSWQGRIKSKTKHPIISLISPHVDPIDILIVDGKRFEHVRGLNQFYLPVSNLNAIVFVVDERGYSCTFHAYDMSTREDIAIPVRSTSFGHTIGSSKGLDRAECIENGRVLLTTLDPYAKSVTLTNLASMRMTCTLDLHKRTAVSKDFYYDKLGRLILERGD